MTLDVKIISKDDGKVWVFFERDDYLAYLTLRTEGGEEVPEEFVFPFISELYPHYVSHYFEWFEKKKTNLSHEPKN